MTPTFTPISGQIAKITEKAILFKQPGRETWIPKSAVEDGDEMIETPRDFKYEICVAKWFAEKEGLE